MSFYIIAVSIRPSIETCTTLATGQNGEKKMALSSGETNECQYLQDFYGNFQPETLQYEIVASFHIDSSQFPSQPGYIDSYNFGVSDVSITTILRSATGNHSQQTHNVAGTSLQHHCSVTTLQRRCKDVVAT